MEAFKPLEVIPSQDKGPYALRSALGWCVVRPMKVLQVNVISSNRIVVMKADTQDTAEYHFEIENKCEDFGVKEMLKKTYMIDFNKPSFNDHSIIRTNEGISYKHKRFLRIMEIGNHYQILLPL